MKTWVKLLSLALLCTWTASALAESPQNAAAELKFGYYQPSIDSEFSGGDGPWSRITGSDSLPIFTAELDYQFWHKFGSLGVFGSAGYGYVDGHGLLADGTASSDTTSFSMVPLSTGLVYRFDVLAIRWNVPLVLTLKGGVEYSFWWMRDGLDEISSYTTSDGRTLDAAGGTYGLTGAIGLHILLDIFESHTAKIFDNEMGVNNSYVFIELAHHWLNDFGSDSSLDLSETGLVFGLAFEM